MTDRLNGALAVADHRVLLAPAQGAVGRTDQTSTRAAPPAPPGSTVPAGSRADPRAPGSRPRRPKSPPGSGHELRGEILAAAKALLAGADAPAEVSLRAIADAVGVSTMAIYLHFEDKQALLDAVVEEVFAELQPRMVAAAAGIQDPVAVLCAQGAAYVGFALEHPGPYRYAMLEVGSGERVSPTGGTARSAYRYFAAAVADCIDAGVIARVDPLQVSFDFWTVAHGISALLLTNLPLPSQDRSSFVDRVLRAAALGHAAFPSKWPRSTAPHHTYAEGLEERLL
jgi:AcrR family transcriptional regulator